VQQQGNQNVNKTISFKEISSLTSLIFKLYKKRRPFSRAKTVSNPHPFLKHMVFSFTP